MTETSIWHKDSLSLFSREIHRKHLTADDFENEILFEDEDYWVSKRINKHKFLLLSENYKDLPVMYRSPLEYPECFDKVHIGDKTHYVIKKIKRAVIEPKKTLSPSEFFKMFCDIPHSNPEHWDLYKGINLAEAFCKVMVRVSANKMFGKNSIPSALRKLTHKVRSITPASFPALLRQLTSTKYVFITEPKMFEHFDTFLEIVGDREDHFENPKLESRSAGTENVYDTTNLSLLLGYNTLEEYSKNGHQDNFFDNIFDEWIQSRYLPFLLNGKIQFFKQAEYNDETHNELLEWVRNYNYYLIHWREHLHNYSVDLTQMKWDIRYIETFNEFVKIFDFVSKSEKEFDRYIENLINTHNAYNRMVNGNTMTLQEHNIPKKAERIKEEPLKVTKEDIDMNYSPQTTSPKGFSEAVVVSPLSPLDFINTYPEHECDIDDFLNKYEEKQLNKMLSDGDVFEVNKNGKLMIKVLE